MGNTDTVFDEMRVIQIELALRVTAIEAKKIEKKTAGGLKVC